ncbi:MAG: hypothetical protein GQ542_05045 [Desulforhopalus sp.]|nr:hypothetical protein [Desulforhopalus sp.]
MQIFKELQPHDIFYFKRNMKMFGNILNIATTQQKMLGEIFSKEKRELEKTATPMKNVSEIAQTADPDQTQAVMLRTIKEATEVHLTNLNSITEAHGFFGSEFIKALFGGPPTLEKFADDFAITEEISGPGLRKKQSGLKYGLKNTAKELFYETPHFNLFEITPDQDADKGLAGTPREKVKPMVFFLPAVLGSDVGALLEEMNMLKYFANKGIPVYLADLKPIDTTEAVQNIGIDEYTADMALMTAKTTEKHGKPTTAVGYCMGGSLTTIAILSGEIKNVDATFRIVAPGGGEGMFDDLLALVPPEYSGTKAAQKELPSGNKIIDGLSLQRVISDVDETVLPATTQYLEAITRTFKNVQKGKKGISEKGAAIQYYLNGGPAGRPPNIPVGLTDMCFLLAHDKVADDGSTTIHIKGKQVNFRKLPENLRIVNFLGNKDNIARISDSVGPMHKHLEDKYKRGQIQDVIKPVGHLAFATGPDKLLIHAIDTQAQLTYQYNLWDQLEKELGSDFLSENNIESRAVISPQTLPDEIIDLLMNSLENLETQKTVERDNNIKYLKQQKVWNSLVNTLDKEFLAEHEITCEMVTGRISFSSETVKVLSEALQENKGDDNGVQIDELIKAITAITEEIN